MYEQLFTILCLLFIPHVGVFLRPEIVYFISEIRSLYVHQLLYDNG